MIEPRRGAVDAAARNGDEGDGAVKGEWERSIRGGPRPAGYTALHAEWTKVRTAPGVIWLLAGAAVLTAVVGAAADAAVTCPAAGCVLDPAKTSLTGIDLGQAVVAVVAVLVISGEYSTGMIRVTLAAMPRRTTVLAAKAVILTGLVLVAGTVAVLVSVLAGRLILPGRGLTPAHGIALLSLGDGPVLRAAAGSVLYLALIGLLSLGVATAVREAAVAIGIVLGLLYLWPILASVVTNAHLAAAPTADRADERRARHRGHHRPAQPAHRPVAGPGRARGLGRGRVAGRRPAAAAAGRVNGTRR